MLFESGITENYCRFGAVKSEEISKIDNSIRKRTSKETLTMLMRSSEAITSIFDTKLTFSVIVQ